MLLRMREMLRWASTQRFRHLRATSVMLAALGCSLAILPTLCFAIRPQDEVNTQNLTLPRLSIRGPRFQLLKIEICYFDQGQCTKTEIRRFEIGNDADIDLEFGHEGIRVNAVIPTDQTVQLTVFDDEAKLNDLVSDHSGVSSLELGKVPETEDALDRGELSEASKRMVQNFARALNEPDRSQARSLVKSEGARNIEWQTLESFLSSITSELGKPDSALSATDTTVAPFVESWLQWDGELGAVMLDGPIPFKDATCFFTLAVIEDQLVDVQFR